MSLDKLRSKKEDLENQLILKQADAKPHRAALSVIDRDIGVLKNQISEIQSEIDRHKISPTVTDHAVLRYLERKYGFDFEKTRKEILTPKLREAMKVGVSGYKVEGGKFVIKGNSVVTFKNNY